MFLQEQKTSNSTFRPSAPLGRHGSKVKSDRSLKLSLQNRAQLEAVLSVVKKEVTSTVEVERFVVCGFLFF